jgi:hypothetical protein
MSTNTGPSKLQVLVVAVITMFGMGAIAPVGASTADPSPSVGADEGGPTHMQAADEEQEGDERENVTIRVMKHVCSAQHVQNVDDFESVDLNGDGETQFVDKVLACPTVVEPGDEYADGTFHLDDRQDFNFEIEGANGDVQGMDEATFEQRQVCESEEGSEDADATTGVVGADVTGDGDQDDCLDTSLYRYDGVADGEVTVTETDSPGVTEAGALEFTPQALNPNDDADTLLEEENEVFADDSSIELDTTRDEDGAITLHVYDFAECPTTTATAEEGPQNELSWSEVEGADEYNVYRATADGDFEQIATVEDGTSFTDTDVEEQQTYRYQVKAVMDGEESQACNTAEVTAIPTFTSAVAVASAAALGVGSYAVARRRS